MGSPVHVSDKGQEPWNIREDDVFQRYVDSDPFELSSSDNTAERSSSEDFANLFNLSYPSPKGGEGSSPEHQYGGDSFIKSRALEISDADLFRHFSSEAAKINERVSVYKPFKTPSRNTNTKSAQPTAVCIPETTPVPRPTSHGVSRSQASIGNGTSPPMAQPRFSRRPSQQRLTERLEESAQRFDASSQNHESMSPTPCAGGTPQAVGQVPHSMPNFSTPTRTRRPLSYQGVPSTNNAAWNNAHMFSPGSQFQSHEEGNNNEWTYPQPHEPPGTPFFGGETSPGSINTVTSPQADHGARWDQTQLANFESFMMPSNAAANSRQNRIQPIWSTPPAENNYAFYQNAQYGPVRSFSQDTIYGDDKTSMAMNGLLIDCNASGGGYKHESGALLARRNAFAPAPPNITTNMPQQQQHQQFPNPHSNAPHFSPYPQHRSPSPQRITAPSTPRSRRASRNQSNPSHNHRRSKSGQSPHNISRPSSAGVTPRRSKSIGAGGGHMSMHEPSLPGASSSSRSRSVSGKSGVSYGHPSVGQHGGGGGGGSGAGFVNYTPNDSRKILTGVAPSGSSKTKARREKEAAEKRRKWSEAATKAILAAGGTLESLPKDIEKEEILNMLEME